MLARSFMEPSRKRDWVRVLQPVEGLDMDTS